MRQSYSSNHYLSPQEVYYTILFCLLDASCACAFADKSCKIQQATLGKARRTSRRSLLYEARAGAQPQPLAFVCGVVCGHDSKRTRRPCPPVSSSSPRCVHFCRAHSFRASLFSSPHSVSLHLRLSARAQSLLVALVPRISAHSAAPESSPKVPI